jgi:hypothetical protein
MVALIAGARAEASPAPPGVPSILCKDHQSVPGEGKTTIPGVYSYRPHNCLFHKYQLSRPAFQLYAKIHWRYWTDTAAFGVGGIPGIEVGDGEWNVYYEPTTILLQHPLFVCGRPIFTEAVVEFPEEEFVYHELLDRLPIPGTGC